MAETERPGPRVWAEMGADGGLRLEERGDYQIVIIRGRNWPPLVDLLARGRFLLPTSYAEAQREGLRFFAIWRIDPIWRQGDPPPPGVTLLRVVPEEECPPPRRIRPYFVLHPLLLPWRYAPTLSGAVSSALPEIDLLRPFIPTEEGIGPVVRVTVDEDGEATDEGDGYWSRIWFRWRAQLPRGFVPPGRFIAPTTRRAAEELGVGFIVAWKIVPEHLRVADDEDRRAVPALVGPA